MRDVSDYANLKTKTFWDTVNKQAEESAEAVTRAFATVMERPLAQEEASQALDALFIDSHARILKHNKLLAQQLPLKQFSKNKLKGIHDLWWVDHYTGGLNPFSTLRTFMERGVSTHFVQDFQGYPLYVVPLCHAAWHEPRRNKDSFSIEIVNPGGLHKEVNAWHFWAGPLPLDLIQKLPPVRLATPYRGVKALLPFSMDQVIYNVALKRIVNAAYPERLCYERMTQHTDWRESKTDMGPLWPNQDINAAVFETDPLLEYSFIQEYMSVLAEPGNIAVTDGISEEANPQYADIPEDSDSLTWDIADVQSFLVRVMHYELKVDGSLGPDTRTKIKLFQNTYNRNNSREPLKEDGIPGPKTVHAMQSVNQRS